MSLRAECRGLLNARDSYLVFTVMAAFLELPTDEVEFVRGSVFIRVIRGRIRCDGNKHPVTIFDVQT